MAESAGADVWFGATDLAEEGVWTDVTGLPLTFFNWSPVQPDNLWTTNGNQNCGAVKDGGWDDLSCSVEDAVSCYACQYGN